MGAQASKSTPPGEAFAGLAHSVVTCSSGASHSSPTPSSSGCNVRILEPAGAAKADSDSTCSLPGDGERAALADAEGQDCGWQQAGQVQLLSQVTGLQERLALLSDAPLLAFPEAAEIAAHDMGADLCAIWVFTPAPAAAVLLGCYGAGAAPLERASVLRGGDAAALARAAAAGAGRFAASLMPRAVERALGDAGLAGSTLVAIGPPGAPLGALMLACRDPVVLRCDRLQVRLQAAAMGLLHHVRQGQVAQVAGLLREVAEAEDPVATVAALLAGTRRFMRKCAGLQATPRLALLQPSGGGERALMFEPRGGAEAHEPGSTASDGGGGEAGAVAASQLELKHTLLASALGLQSARFISNVPHYMQSCARPARDVFTPASGPVASLVALPLAAAGSGSGAFGAFGALYLALDSPCDFGGFAAVLAGFAHAVGGPLRSALAGKLELLEAMVAKACDRCHSPALGAGSDAAAEAQNQLEPGRLGPQGPQHPAGGGGSALPPPRAPGLQLSRASSRRLNAGSMMQAMQRELQAEWRRGAELRCAPALVVGPVLGLGASAAVHLAWWHRVAVAAKIMPARACERQLLRDASEMAMLSSVQHPNIVRAYACLTDMVEDEEGSEAGSSTSSGGGVWAENVRSRFRRMRADDPEWAAPCNILVMEHCDRGTLRDAVRAGAFHRALPDGALGVDLLAAAEALMAVACALAHLHSVRIVHGGMRPGNILLKTEAGGALTVPKVADFGHARMLEDDGCCTMAEPSEERGPDEQDGFYRAPELSQAGARVTAAIDTFAFGSLMHDLHVCYTGPDAPPGAGRARRKALPSNAPCPYAGLAAACRARDPSARPAMAEVADGLQAIVEWLRAGGAGAGAPGGA